MDELRKRLAQRIRAGRERLRLTQKQLADLVGFTHDQTISEIEKAGREVKAWELAAIGRALHLDITELLAVDMPEVPCVLWRKTPERDREKLEARFVERCRRYKHVEEACGFTPDCDLPRTKVSMADLDYRTARELAMSCADALGLGKLPAASLQEAIEDRCGVKVWFEDLGESGSGASTVADFGPAILINSIEPPWRRNFSLAHELFHVVTWHGLPPDRVGADEQTWKHVESCAEVFASHLLLPTEVLNREVDRRAVEGKIDGADIVILARRFGVSTEALIWRLVNAHRVRREDAQRALEDQSFQSLDRTTMPAAWGRKPPKMPKRFVRLAFRAYVAARLSRMRLAEYLETSLIDLPKRLAEYGLDVDAAYDTEVTIEQEAELPS